MTPTNESQLINCWGVHRTGKQIVDILKLESCGHDIGDPSNKWNRLGAYLAAQGVEHPADTALNYHNFSIDPDKPEHLAFILKLAKKDPEAEKLYQLMQTVYMHWIYKADGKATGEPWLDLLEHELPKLLAEKPNALLICTRCPVLCQAFEFGGAGHAEPLWFAVLRIVAHCEPRIAIEVSDGHEKYTHAELEARLERIAREQLKPSTCKYISDFSPLCSGCKWQGHIKSPIALGYANTPKKREVAYAN